jgi:hypothetical protein
LCTTAEISSTLSLEQIILKLFLGNEKAHPVFGLFEGEREKPARKNGEEELERDIASTVERIIESKQKGFVLEGIVGMYCGCFAFSFSLSL